VEEEPVVTRGRSQPLLLEVRDRQQLRAWLETNHAASPGVMLAVTRKGGTVTSLTYDDAVEEGLSFGWIDSTVHALDAERQTVLFTPRRRGSDWSRSNKERVSRLTEQGLMTPAGLAAVEIAKADGSWTALDEVEALVLPADLVDALAAQPGAAAGFAARTSSQRKLALQWIASAKREATRTGRIAEVVRAAAEGRPLH
jgi:uncharacterized protein YdeI (YjbR/CyaY-like superfamily)